MGSFDEDGVQDIVMPPVRHIFSKEKASWYALSDDGAERCEEIPDMAVLK